MLKKMWFHKRSLKHFLIGLLVCFLPWLQIQACTPDFLESGGFEIQALPSGFVTDYLLKVQENFRIQAVDDQHQADVDKAVASFEADMEAGSLTDYFQSPDFSIKLAAGSEGSYLAAGSEGSYFNPEIQDALTENAAVFAQAVIFNDGQDTADIYKGQFNNGRFYFDNEASQFISPDNITYLVTLTPALETEVFKGQLAAGSEGSYLAAGSEGSYLAAGSEGSYFEERLSSEDKALLADNKARYQEALVKIGALKDDYEQLLKGVKFVPAFDPPQIMYTETFARLVRAYGQEIQLEMAMMRGLPDPLSYQALLDMVAQFEQRWEDECGEPVPDEGGLYPQRTPEFTAVPLGYQTPELAAVIEAIPELKAELDERQTLLPPERQRLTPFPQLIGQYRASHPEVFEQVGWRDTFAPPDCVQPRQARDFRIPGAATPPGVEPARRGPGGPDGGPGAPPAGGPPGDGRPSGPGGDRPPPPPDRERGELPPS